MKTTGTPAVEWPPGGASSAKSTASPRRASTDFGALLDNHQARTAVAEGPKKEAKLEKKLEKDASTPAHGTPAQPHAEPKKAESRDAAPAAEPPAPADGEQATVETPVLVVDPLVELSTPVIAEPQVPVTAPVAEQPAAEVPVQQQPVAAEPVPVEAAPTAAPVAVDAPVIAQPAETAAPVTEQAAQPQPQAQQQQQPQTQPPVAPVVGDEAPAKAPVADAPETPVARVDKPAQPQQAQGPNHQPGSDPQPEHGADQRRADQRPAEQPRTQAPDARPEMAAKPEPKGAVAPAATPAPAPQAAPVTAPVGTPAPQAVANAAPQALSRSVPLSSAAEAVENVIRLGSARGVSHARMSLRPAELGGVEIRLQQTAGGLVASVVAEGAEAAQLLQQAGQDLRRQLESHGIELQRLDISHSGEERSGARSAEAGDGERRSSTENDNSHATDGGDLTPTDETSATSTLELPDGVLVDVLA